MEVVVCSVTRLFPETKIESPRAVPLSIVEKFATSSTAELLLYYDRPLVQVSELLLLNRLQDSLSRTLNILPQYAGRLVATEDTRRRFQLVWGTPDDTGLPFIIARCKEKLSDLVPDANERRGGCVNYKVDETLMTSFVPDSSLRESPMTLVIQVTLFACGGFVICIAANHALMDGVSVSLFGQLWSHIHEQAWNPSISSVPPAPIFNPQLLDKEAAGDIESEAPDPKLVDTSNSMQPLRTQPLLTGGQSAKALSHSEISESFALLHFSSGEVLSIWEAACTDAQISVHDALTAHLWRAVINARGLSDEDDMVNISHALDLRPRLNLPSNLMGNPITLAHTSLTAHEVLSEPLADIAFKLKSSLQNVSTEQLKAMLHKLSFVDPVKWASARRSNLQPTQNTIASNFTRIDYYKIKFYELIPRLWLPRTTSMSSAFYTIMSRPRSKLEKRQFFADGIDVFMKLDSKTMDLLLSDKSLRFPK